MCARSGYSGRQGPLCPLLWVIIGAPGGCVFRQKAEGAFRCHSINALWGSGGPGLNVVGRFQEIAMSRIDIPHVPL